MVEFSGADAGEREGWVSVTGCGKSFAADADDFDRMRRPTRCACWWSREWFRRWVMRCCASCRGGADAAGDLSAHDLTLENSVLRVMVDRKNGCITSLYDKRAHFESMATGACGNELIAFKDKPKDYDAWNIDANFEKSFTRLDMADSVQLVERGPLRATIRVTRTWQHSKFPQDITLYAGLDRVDVVNDFDWHETHVLLKAAFPLAAASEHATYEIPYGSIERPTTRNNSWEAAKFEVPALRWADLGDAAARIQPD